jgi:hypothetical protein
MAATAISFDLDSSRMHSDDTSPDAASPFRRTLVRVMAVQVVTLALLWLLQSRYGG